MENTITERFGGLVGQKIGEVSAVGAWMESQSGKCRLVDLAAVAAATVAGLYSLIEWVLTMLIVLLWTQCLPFEISISPSSSIDFLCKHYTESIETKPSESLSS